MNSNSYQITAHTLQRMITRGVDRNQLAATIKRGKAVHCSDGRYRVQYRENYGRHKTCIEAIYSKEENTVVTVWRNDFTYNTEGRKVRVNERIKQFKQRKRELHDQENMAHCREELRRFNYRFFS
jgi:hypothetical protein